MNTYERDGYQLIRPAIPPTDLQPFRQCIQTQVGSHAQKLMEAGNIGGLHEDLPFAHRLASYMRTMNCICAPGISLFWARSSMR